MNENEVKWLNENEVKLAISNFVKRFIYSVRSAQNECPIQRNLLLLSISVLTISKLRKRNISMDLGSVKSPIQAKRYYTTIFKYIF